MLIEEFDRASPEVAAALLRPCADVPAWIDVLVAGRPYGHLKTLLDAAAEAAAVWAEPEVVRALAHHPRIGEAAEGDDAEADLSRREQEGLGTADQHLDAAIALGNRAYEQRFGRIFLIRAAGRTRAEVLRELTRRIENDPETEIGEVAGQLREIALGRLEGLFTP